MIIMNGKLGALNQFNKAFRRNATKALRKGLGLSLALIVFSLPIAQDGGVAQPQPTFEAGDFYVTKVEQAPDGTVLTPLDLSLGLFNTVIRGLSHPENVLCGADERLYLTETFSEKNSGGTTVIKIQNPVLTIETSKKTFHRILRFNLDGSGQTTIAEWDSQTLQPSTITLASNGDLYFGTTSEDGKQAQGVWRIKNAVRSGGEFNLPEQMLPPQMFLSPMQNTSYSIRPLAFLSTGPFQNDLLIIDAPVQAFIEGGRVVRAIAPDFSEVEAFIPAFIDSQTQRPFKPSGLAIDPNGDILITDFTNDKILKYAPNGTFVGVFAQLQSPNQITIGLDGYVYVTNLEFRGKNIRGRLFIFDAEGMLVWNQDLPMFLRGITVCPTS